MNILIIPGVTMPKVEESLLVRIREAAGPGVCITVAKSASIFRELRRMRGCR